LQIIKFTPGLTLPDRHAVTISHHGSNPLEFVKASHQPLTVFFNNYRVDWNQKQKDRALSVR
jgi:hypothetical protein